MTLIVDLPDLDHLLTQATANALQRHGQELHRIAGVYVLNQSRLAYIAKSKGQQGSDGITWKPIARGTAEARVRRRAPARRIVAKRRQLAERIKSEKSEAAREKLRKQREAESAKLQALIDAEHAKAKTGIDTGLQINSAQPGYQPPDGQGGNVFRLQQNQVTVGFGRSYSTYFDAQRTLLPERLPVAWEQGLSKLLTKTVEQILREALG
jgi:hypothetical protein